MNAFSTAPERNDRLQSLDLLRFIAAMSVMVYHFTYRPSFLGADSTNLFPYVQAVSKFGYLGVELFFLISGFVILWSASGRSAVSYVASRASRLVPSLWSGIAVTTCVLLMFNKADELSLKVILANMGLVAGYLGLPYVDGVYWTLQVEVKFYVLVFILICVRQIPNIERWLLVWLAALAFTYLPFSPKWLRSFVIFPYGSYFIGGSVFFLIWSRGFTFSRLAYLLASLILSGLCVWHEAPNFMNNDDRIISLAIAILVVIGFYALFLAISLRRISLPASKLWFELGALTYPLYLLHNQIGKTLAAAISSNWGYGLALCVAFLVPLALAVLFAKTIERIGCPWLRQAMLNRATRWRLAS